MIVFAVLLLAAVPPPTATPWPARRPPTARIVPLAEPTLLPPEINLSDIAGKLRLKREDGAPITISGLGAGGCLVPLELRKLPQPIAIGEVGAYQMGRAIRIWFWLHGEGGQEIRAAVCTILEVWSHQQEIYHFEKLLIPEDFSDLTLGSLLKPDEHHLGVVFRDRAFEEFLRPPGGSVNIVVRIRMADGQSLQSGVTLSLTP